MMLFYSVAIILFDFFVSGQYVQSPCPDLFEYQNDGSGVYGVVRIQGNGPVSSLTTRANFTIAARLTNSYVGHLEPIGSELQLQQFNQGGSLTYRVNFPVTSPLPRLTALTVNGRVLCYGPGDVPDGPNQYVSTISLQHMLFFRPGQGPVGGNKNQFQPRPSKPNTVYEFVRPGGNTQVFSFDTDDDRLGTWNNDFYPNLVVNDSRPQYDTQTPAPTPPSRQPSRPESTFQYYPQLPPATRPQPIPPPPPTFSSTPPRLPSSPTSTQVECGLVAGGNERLPLIFNGQSYSRGDWPWLVAIYKRKAGSLTFACSGTLISDRHVVSAAHCMRQKNTFTHIRDIVVKAGVYNLEDWGDDITVTRTLETAYIHESYNPATLENDILVFTFERQVQFNTNIRPACLWSGNNELSRIVGASGVVAGWGTNELSAGGHGEPRMVRVPIVSTATCRASRPDFHKLTSANTLCAGDRNGAGPCLGDSGGGLYILDGGRWRLRGVVSLSLRPENGDSSCNLNEYIVFTDAAKYLRWIKNILDKK